MLDLNDFFLFVQVVDRGSFAAAGRTLWIPKSILGCRITIIASVDGYAHPTSTVPMGGAGDPGVVVDAKGAVRGVDSLHVVDASIMPDIVSAPTNVTTIMMADAISRKLR